MDQAIRRQGKAVGFMPKVGSGRIRYTDIVDNLIDAVEKGLLLPGDRLLPQRILAYRLKIAVGTVTRAYAEAERRGIVVAEVGRGTFINRMPVAGSAITADGGQDLIDFTHNRLPIDGYVGEFCTTLGYLSKRPNVAAMLDYPPSASDARFRTAGATWIRRTGLTVAPEQVVICNGVQHALAVIFGAFSKPGELVMTEELSYPGIRLLEKIFHLRLKGIPINEHGIDPDALEEACRVEAPKFLFCQPTVHNPTAVVMPQERRKKIGEIVEKYGISLIEDDIYAFLPQRASLPISALVPERSFYVTGTSKTIGTGVRVGYIVAPPRAVHELNTTVHGTTWIPAPFMAELVSMWIIDGTTLKIVEWHRREARKRQQIVSDVLKGFTYSSQESAYHIWLSLPASWRQEDFVRECLSRNIAINSSENFVIGQALTPHAVRICLGGFRSADNLERGLGVLREVLAEGPRRRPFMV
jgi:DNA-binding transcriptional MocR family regulator